MDILNVLVVSDSFDDFNTLRIKSFYLNLLASRSDSSKVKRSPSRTSPFTFRMICRFCSPRNSTLTCVHCPCEPVWPRTLITRTKTTDLSMFVSRRFDATAKKRFKKVKEYSVCTSRFNSKNAIHKDVSLKSIWEHLESMYDLMALDYMEDLRFPSQETDFSLPEQDFLGPLKSRKREEPEVNLKEQKDKYEDIKKEKDVKDLMKKDIVLRDLKGSKDIDKKKEEFKEYVKDMEIKKDKHRDIKDVKKDYKYSKGKSKGKNDLEEAASNGKKERKDSDSGRESLKRGPKRPTRLWITRLKHLQVRAIHLHQNVEEYNNFYKVQVICILYYDKT